MSRVAVIGGGVLGMTLAWRLARRGLAVDLIESAPRLGGLAAPYDYGGFTWDRFYHCILPSDARLIGLITELGLQGELRWTRTRTGLHAGGRTYSVSGSSELLRLPLLGLVDKARLAWCSVYASRLRDLHGLRARTAAEWLESVCGRRAYEVFWKPLLQAKFGPFHDRVAATFIVATIRRLMRARSGAARAEHLGYVSGGYARILGRLEEVSRARGVRALVDTLLIGVEERGEDGCRIRLRSARGGERVEDYAQVLFTAPTRHLREGLGTSAQRYVRELEQRYPSSAVYLGVICCNLVLARPLTPFYVLNIAAPEVELTGLIEMTNLIDPARETSGRSLVYLPRYLPSDSPEFARSDAELLDACLERGLRRLFPTLERGAVLSASVQRAPLVQPLPLAQPRGVEVHAAPPPTWRSPFAVLNTSMLDCSTLNNDEVVGLVDDYVARHARDLDRLVSRGAALAPDAVGAV